MTFNESKEIGLDKIIPILKLLKGDVSVDKLVIASNAKKAHEEYMISSVIASVTAEAFDHINGFAFNDSFLNAYFNAVGIDREAFEDSLFNEGKQ